MMQMKAVPDPVQHQDPAIVLVILLVANGQVSAETLT